MRAEYFLSNLTKLDDPGERKFLEAFMECELIRCAVTIAVAYLNPGK